MKTKVLYVIAGAVLAISMSTAAANDVAAKAPAETHQTKSSTAKEPANGSSGPGAQQNKMKHCNEEARKKELKGDVRRAFMSTCLKG